MESNEKKIPVNFYFGKAAALYVREVCLDTRFKLPHSGQQSNCVKANFSYF